MPRAVGVYTRRVTAAVSRARHAAAIGVLLGAGVLTTRQSTPPAAGAIRLIVQGDDMAAVHGINVAHHRGLQRRGIQLTNCRELLAKK